MHLRSAEGYQCLADIPNYGSCRSASINLTFDYSLQMMGLVVKVIVINGIAIHLNTYNVFICIVHICITIHK